MTIYMILGLTHQINIIIHAKRPKKTSLKQFAAVAIAVFDILGNEKPVAVAVAKIGHKNRTGPDLKTLGKRDSPFGFRLQHEHAGMPGELRSPDCVCNE